MRSSALSLVIVLGIEIEGAERVQNAMLFASFHVFRERRRNGFLLGLMTARSAGFLDQFVVECEIGSHVYIITHGNV